MPEQSGKRARTKKQITNVETLKRSNWSMQMYVLVSLLNNAHNIFLTDVVSFREQERHTKSHWSVMNGKSGVTHGSVIVRR